MVALDAHDGMAGDPPVAILREENLANALTRIDMPQHALDRPVHAVHVAALFLAQDLERLTHTRSDQLNFGPGLPIYRSDTVGRTLLHRGQS